MIRNASIDNFRGFESVSINDMRRVTLISGRNNIGKSTILEALFLMLDHTSSDSFAKVNGFRGSSLGGVGSLWEPLFHKMDTDREISICIHDGEISSSVTYKKDKDYLPYIANGVPDDVLAAFRSVAKNYYSLLFTYDSGEYHEEGHYFLNGITALREIKTNLPGNEIQHMPRTRWLNPAVIRLSDTVLNDLGELEIKNKKEEVVRILRELDSDIEDIVTLSVQGITQLYLKISGRLIPLQYAGDGVMKLLQISMAIMESKDGILLIDEIEGGFHYSMYGKLWSIIDRISISANCQVIATTHSYELISAVRESIDHVEDFSYYRIGLDGKAHVAHHYSYDMLDSALEADMEVR